jgi:hypothetical protein
MPSYPAGYIAPSVAVTTPANPTAPASTSATYLMQGLAAVLTPATPAANIAVTIQGYFTDTATTVGEGIALQLYYGPVLNGVAPPANAAAVPASAVTLGNPLKWATGVTLTTAADLFEMFNIDGLAKGLTPGQQYWFDLGAYSITTASAVGLNSVTVILQEIG